MIRSRRIEDVPEELIHHIQSRLPVKEAARTSVLSKSWLQAWSTIPTLRFPVRESKGMKVVDIERILFRYLRDSTPIESLNLDIEFKDKESASLAERCIRTMATKTCTLKKLTLRFQLSRASFDLPHDIFSCENLTKIEVINGWGAAHNSLWMTRHHPITVNCVSLRELRLERVNINQELLDCILWSGRLLEKIELERCSKGLNAIKIKNFPCLYHLGIATEDAGSTALEINNVPNLRVFTCDLCVPERNPPVPFNAHSITLGSRLTQLWLNGVVTDNESLDMIKSGVPFLESLTLDMSSWKSERCHFTCASIKRLSLVYCGCRIVDLKVYAPNLLFFLFEGCNMPSLLFPVSTLIKQTTFDLRLRLPVDASFFLKTREALALTSNCNVHISLDHGHILNHEPPPWDINLDDLRTRLPFPRAMKVQRLVFQTWWIECPWEHHPFFDAFFEICHPSHVTAKNNRGFANSGMNYFCKVMLREVLERQKKITTASWPHYLKNVKIKRDQNWETLTTSHRSFLDGATRDPARFKLMWQ